MEHRLPACVGRKLVESQKGTDLGSGTESEAKERK